MRQGVAHRRLALVQPHGRTRDVLLVQQRMQGHEQVQVDALKWIRHANSLDA